MKKVECIVLHRAVSKLETNLRAASRSDHVNLRLVTVPVRRGNEESVELRRPKARTRASAGREPADPGVLVEEHLSHRKVG